MTEETSILAKDGNFAYVPDVLPVEDTIANVESGIHTLPQDAKIAMATCQAAYKCNINTKEIKAIKNLNTDKNTLILPTDKGNATVAVVLNVPDY